MKKTVLSMIPSTSLNTVICTALVVTLGVGISACSSEKETDTDSGKVMAVDRVQQATDIAKANRPEAEDMGFAETAPMATVTPDTEADTMDFSEEAAAAGMPDTNTSADTDMAAADTSTEDSAAEPAADTTVAEPVTD